MRITNTMLINNMIGYMNNNLERMDKYQGQLATGQKIRVPSDDPIVAARALTLRTNVSIVAQYKSNANDAKSWIETTETALSNINDIFQRARELAVQAANGSLTPEDREKISQEVNQLKAQIINISNSTYGNRYIFSGYKTDQKLLNSDGYFNIDVKRNESIRYEVGIDDQININIPGNLLFNSGNDVTKLPAKSSLIQDFDNFVDALGSNATYTGSSTVPMTENFPLNATGFDDLKITIDGVDYAVDLTDQSSGTYDVSAMTADQLLAEINKDLGGAGTAAINNKGQLTIQSSTIGPSSTVAVSAGNPDHVSALFGTAPKAVQGTPITAGALTGSKDMNAPVFLYTPMPFDATGYNDISVSFDGNSPIAIDLTGGMAVPPAADITKMSADEIVAEINADIAAAGGGGSASLVDGRIVFKSDTTGPASSVSVTAASDAHMYALFGTKAAAVSGSDTTSGSFSGSQLLLQSPPSIHVIINGTDRVVNLGDNTAGVADVDPKAMTLEQIVREINADLGSLGAASIVDNTVNGAVVGKCLRISATQGGTGSQVKITASDQNLLTALFGADPVINNAGDQATKATYTGGTDLSGAVLSFGAGARLTIDIDRSGAPVTVDISAATDLDGIVNLINAELGNRGTASIVNGKYLCVTSPTWGTGSKVEISASTPDIMKTLFGNGTSTPPEILPGVNGFSADMDSMIAMLDKHMENLSVLRSDIGARTNRLDLTLNRLDSDNMNFTKQMSDNEDVDTAEVIMNLQSAENVYRASLAGGARIIQPTLVDFLK